jgi:hypothetical protein
MDEYWSASNEKKSQNRLEKPAIIPISAPEGFRHLAEQHRRCVTPSDILEKRTGQV